MQSGARDTLRGDGQRLRRGTARVKCQTACTRILLRETLQEPDHLFVTQRFSSLTPPARTQGSTALRAGGA